MEGMDVKRAQRLIRYLREPNVLNYVRAYPDSKTQPNPPIEVEQHWRPWGNEPVYPKSDNTKILLLKLLDKEWYQLLEKSTDEELRALTGRIKNERIAFYTREQSDYLKKRGCVIKSSQVKRE